MNFELLGKIVNDKNFYDFKKMSYKYGADNLKILLDNLKEISYQSLPLKDFRGNPVYWLPTKANMSDKFTQFFLQEVLDGKIYNISAMKEEISSSLRIENINSSKENLRKAFQGLAGEGKEEEEVFYMKKALDFIAMPENKINEKNMTRLYKNFIEVTLEDDYKLPSKHIYRDDWVYITGDRVYHQGLDARFLADYMEDFYNFIDQNDQIPILVKAAILHFYLAYLHPWFDGNGRMARLLHLWYLIEKGFSASLFYSHSKYIDRTKAAYYKSFVKIEENYKLTGILDLTPFIIYYQDMIYAEIGKEGQLDSGLETYKKALSQGLVTKKEEDLWNFVLSFYAKEDFSTKELERDFANAAYATIRSFVLKFEELGLLSSQKYSNRVRYRIRKS